MFIPLKKISHTKEDTIGKIQQQQQIQNNVSDIGSQDLKIYKKRNGKILNISKNSFFTPFAFYF